MPRGGSGVGARGGVGSRAGRGVRGGRGGRGGRGSLSLATARSSPAPPSPLSPSVEEESSPTSTTSPSSPAAVNKGGKKGMANTPARRLTMPGDEPGARRFTESDLELLETGMFADATIMCLKRVWKVHKTIMCARSAWFFQAFQVQYEEGQTGVVNLHDHEEEDVDTMIKFIYTGKLDMDKFGLDKGSFVMYTDLFNLGDRFQLPQLQEDAQCLMGCLCDFKLKELCSYDVNRSSRAGIISDETGPDDYMEDLFKAIWKAYTETGMPENPTIIQEMLATFVWAGRDRLLCHAGFNNIATRFPRFGNDIFKLMLGKSEANYLPEPTDINKIAVKITHGHRSQHPDRCVHCNDVFDDNRSRKAAFNPFEATVRHATYCSNCVLKNQESDVPLWRMPPEFNSRIKVEER
ncbi:hypothetical protein B0T25DRAFT_612762 [Lasiosphaeria hispida]|uniref:BTB domain-containing protein n=1 Tax=Lasiosphaeria hispida TaxID=260671 RepID=A0AAJ0MAZ6_9PEZI|nr:hypothetical protein B0T25DRAFT_612762 [Lasiosphaeria hispida]